MEIPQEFKVLIATKRIKAMIVLNNPVLELIYLEDT